MFERYVVGDGGVDRDVAPAGYEGCVGVRSRTIYAADEVQDVGSMAYTAGWLKGSWLCLRVCWIGAKEEFISI